MKWFGSSPGPKPGNNTPTRVKSSKANSASKQSHKLKTGKNNNGVSQDSLNVSITYPDRDDDCCFDEFFEEEEEDEGDQIDFGNDDDDNADEVDESFYDDYYDDGDDDDDDGETIKLDGVKQVFNRGEVDTIFKYLDDFKRSDKSFLEHEAKEDWETCNSLLYTQFLENYTDYRSGLFMASVVGRCVKGFQRYTQDGTPFCQTNIKLIMNNHWKRPKFGSFEVKTAILHHQSKPLTCYNPPIWPSPQQLGVDMEPYIGKLLEKKLFAKTEKQWKVMESGSLISDDGLCLCKIDGVAVQTEHKDEKLFLEFKYVQPFKSYKNLESAIEATKATKSLPVLQTQDKGLELNPAHLYGHQVRLSMGITKLTKGLIVFGLDGLHKDTNNVDKIQFLEFTEKSDYLTENQQVLLNIIKDIIIPLMIQNKINHRGDPSSTFCEEVKYCIHCDQNVRIINWHNRSHLNSHRICSICKNDFVTVNCLKIHRHQAHGEDPTYKCQVCEKKFVGFDNYRLHQIIHGQVKKHRCDYPLCQSAFFFSKNLTRHKLTHLPKGHRDRIEWTCPSCAKTMDIHSKNMHIRYCSHYRLDNKLSPISPRNLTCRGCELVCTSFSTLCDHRRQCIKYIKTTLAPSELLLNDEQQQQVVANKLERHKCMCVCGQSFIRKKREGHILKCVVYQKNHPNFNVDFSCDGCGKTMTFKNKNRHVASCDPYIKLQLEKSDNKSDKTTEELVKNVKESKKKTCQYCTKKYVGSGLSKHLRMGCPEKVRQELTQAEKNDKSETEIKALVQQKVRSGWQKCRFCLQPKMNVKAHEKVCKGTLVYKEQ